jgi:hypothetical protein
MKQDQSQGETKLFESRIKAVWSLTDDEVVLYGKNEREFYKRLHDLHGISREEAENKIREIKASVQKTANAA